MELNLKKFKSEAWEVIKISEAYLKTIEDWSTKVAIIHKELEEIKDDKELEEIQIKMTEISFKLNG